MTLLHEYHVSGLSNTNAQPDDVSTQQQTGASSF
jgi:hypothetical protein